jgi:lysophospholipase L1-like esterase
MRQRTRRLGWLLVAATPPAFFLIVEGAVRLAGIAPAFERDAALPPWLDRNILVKDARWVELLSERPRELKSYYGTYAWDRDLFYRLRPGLSVPLTDVLAPPGIRERTRWTLRTNGKGFPGREAAYGPHPGTYRIVALGDSSTFGWGVEAEEAYPAVLERELRGRHPAARVEVVNLGVCGYSSFQGRILLEREGLRYEPDLVVISYGSNDWSPVPEPFDEAHRRNAGWQGAVRAVLHRSRAYQIYAAFLARAFSGREVERVRALSGGRADLPLNVGPEKSEGNLVEMVRASREAGADPILASNCVPGAMSEPIRAAARATGATFLDSEAVLKRAVPDIAAGRARPEARARAAALYGEAILGEHPDLVVYLADACHPNAEGHRLLAEELARLVESAPSFRRARGG